MTSLKSRDNSNANPEVLQWILEYINWNGETKMVFPFIENKKKRKATIKLISLYRIIKWE